MPERDDVLRDLVARKLEAAKAERKAGGKKSKGKISKTDRAAWLARCAEVSAAREQLREEMKRVARDAIDAGCTATEVAAALDVGRMTLYRMLKDE